MNPSDADLKPLLRKVTAFPVSAGERGFRPKAESETTDGGGVGRVWFGIGPKSQKHGEDSCPSTPLPEIC